jgi:hypothetical protein
LDDKQVFLSSTPTDNQCIINVKCATGFLSNGPCQAEIGPLVLAQN